MSQSLKSKTINKAEQEQLFSLAALLATIEPIFYFLLITSLSIIRENYSLVRNYISELSGRDAPHSKRTNLLSFILLGVVLILYSFALNEKLKQHHLSGIATALLVISGSSLILLGLVPADGVAPTKIGKWHRWLTGPPALGLPLAMICYSVIFESDKRWQKIWPQFSRLLSVLILVSDSLLLLKRPKKFIGITQRLGMGFALLWMFATARKAYSLN